jgi:hypothetical protein
MKEIPDPNLVRPVAGVTLIQRIRGNESTLLRVHIEHAFRRYFDVSVPSPDRRGGYRDGGNTEVGEGIILTSGWTKDGVRLTLLFRVNRLQELIPRAPFPSGKGDSVYAVTF